MTRRERPVPTIRGELQHLAADEIETMIDPAAFARITAADEHPVVKVFAIGHEGIADGRFLTAAGQPVRRFFRYLRETVQSLYDRIAPGTPIYPDRHGSTMDAAGRVQIGEVVGRAVREIKGAMHALAAIWVYPQFRDRDDDVASIEAFFAGDRADDGSIIVRGIERITGIILGNSRHVRPAFPGATLHGAMQFFALAKGSTMKITLPDGTQVEVAAEQIKAAIRAENLSPSTLYDDEALKADPRVADMLALTGRAAAARKADEMTRKHDEERTAWEREKTTLTTERDTARKEIVGAKRESVLRAIADERKLKDGQAAFIRRALPSFETNATTDEALKADMATFIDTQLNEWRKVGKEAFGLRFDEDGAVGGPKVTPAGDGQSRSNPLINPAYLPQAGA
jgi:hypothetical protein